MRWRTLRTAGLVAVAACVCAAPAWAGTSRADTRRIRAEVERERKKAGEERRRDVALSKYHFEVGRKLFDSMQYEAAKRELGVALELDPNNSGAEKLLRKVQDLLGYRLAQIRVGAENLAEAEKVRVQAQVMDLERHIQQAVDEIEAAMRPPERDLIALPEDQLLSNRVRMLDKAVTGLGRALEITKWLPYPVDTAKYEARAEGLLADAKKLRRQFMSKLNEIKQLAAFQEARRRQQVEERFEQVKVGRLLDHAYMLFDREEYEKAERAAKEVLEIDPFSSQANHIVASSRAKALLKKEAMIKERMKEELISLSEKLDEAAIPYTEYLVYPDDWKEKSKRETRQAERVEEPQWKKEIRRQLDRKVTFEFVGTPLTEAISFLQNLTNVNIILDPKAFEMGEGAEMPVTLKVTRMELRLALKWILRLAQLDYTLKDQAVFISTPERLAGEVELVIYDVRDLTETVQSFPGPEIVIGAAASGAGGYGGGMGGGMGVTFEEGDESIFEASNLADMIQTRVRPESWAVELGTSIEERSGKLVVMQRPEVHALIRELLQNFRESQTLQVSVQSRMIEVRDGFLEDIGVDWGDLPADDWDTTPPANRLTGPYEPITLDGTDFPIEAARGTTPGFHWWQKVYPESDPNPLEMSRTTSYINAWGMRSTAYGIRQEPFGSTLGTMFQAGAGMGGLLQMRFVGNVDAQALLHALKAEETGNLLLAPSITMYNNQRSHIMNATQTVYISDYEVSAGMYDPTISVVMTGIVLDVKPTVSHDRRYITLELRPGSADRLFIDKTHFIEILDAGGTVMAQLPIHMPRLQIRSVRTTATVPDGGTVLLSGLMQETKFSSNQGVPFFSDLPVIGRLFGTDLKQRERTNLLIMVTARLILFEEEEAKL